MDSRVTFYFLSYGNKLKGIEMNNLARLIIIIVSFVLFSSQSLAYSRPHIKTTCPPCQKIVDEYNQLMDDLANAEQTLDDVRKSIKVDEQFIQSDENRITSIESMPTSGKKDQELSTANRVLNNDKRDLKNHQQEEKDLQNKILKMIDDKYDLLDDLEDCEDYYCNPASFYYYNYLMQVIQVQLGLMIGNTPSYRAVFIDDASSRFSANNTQNSADLGLQAKFLFGQTNQPRPTLLFNAAKRFNSTNTLMDTGSIVKLTNNWIARGLIGIESPVFYNQFSAGVGVGVAVFDQSLKANIKGTNITNNSTSAGPSIGANITFYACPNCIFNHPLSISGQVFADRYSSISATQGSLNTTVDQRWQFSEHLTFAVGF